MSRCLPLMVALAAFFGATATAHADQLVVPSLQGKPNHEALALLESVGLAARVIEVAGPAVGKVSTQDPAAGTAVSRGALVTLRVGTKARVKTTMPDVMGQRAEDALEALAVAYDVHVQRTPGPVAQAGSVLRTEPAAGSQIWLRGKVMLFVVSHTAASTVTKSEDAAKDEPAKVEPAKDEPAKDEPAKEEGAAEEDEEPPVNAPPLGSDVMLPDLIGKQLQEAKSTLKKLGLIPNIVRVFEIGATPDEVVMQVPGGPAEVFAGDVVWLRVARPLVPRPDGPTGTPTPDGKPPSNATGDDKPATTANGKIEVPTLVGLDVLRASQEIVRRGLLPHPWYVSREGQDEWKVIAQKDPPGTEMPRFGVVHFRVVLPLHRDDPISMPYLYGLTGQQATAVMRGLGLPTKGRVVDAAGRVTLQVPQAGAKIAWATPVTLTLGKVVDANAAAALPLVVMVPPGQTPPLPDPKKKKKNVIDKVGDFFGDLFD